MTTDPIQQNASAFRRAAAVFRSRAAAATAAAAAGAMIQASAAVPDSALAERLELRGYSQVGGNHAFSVHDKQTGESEWVWDDEPSESYEVEDFDLDENAVTLRYGNRLATVSLQRTRIAQYDPPATSPLPSYEPPSPPPGQSGDTGESRRAQTGTRPSGNPAPTGNRNAADSGNASPDISPAPNTGNNFSGGFLPGGGNAGGRPPENPGGAPPDSSGGDSDAPSGESGGPSRDDDIGPPPPDPDTPPPGYTPDA